MPELPALIRRGIRLPPAGWALAAMLAFYVLAGLFGRDPWKGDDAIHIGTAWHMLHYGDWLSPDLAGRPFDEPPLYYWTAALTGALFGKLLAMHEALRLASAVWLTLALVGIYYAGRELYGQERAAASALLLAGCAGLLVHAHDAQPMLVALAAHCGALGGLAAGSRRPLRGALIYGAALAACLLGAGIAPTLPLLGLGAVALALASDRRRLAGSIAGGLACALIIALPWPLLLASREPERLAAWLAAEINPLLAWPSPGTLFDNLIRLPLFAFPALPLAAWSLWSARPDWRRPEFLLPLGGLLLSLLLLAWAYPPGEIPAMLLLPPIALLATPGALSLRRGAANAFDWFAVCTFSLFGALVWLAWSGMALGWPTHLAQRIVAIRPGFVGHFSLVALLAGLAASLWWLWLVITAPRSPYRSLTHWTLGCTTLWLLATSLVMPWFDYGNSYRPVAEAVAQALPAGHGCLAERGLSDTQRASLAYFVGIEPVAADSAAGLSCNWLLVVGDSRRELAPPDGRWQKIWEGSRAGKRREKFRLFSR